MENNEYFASLINTIVQGDCLEILKNIPDDSVDVTFADPPFNLKRNIIVTTINAKWKNIFPGARTGLLLRWFRSQNLLVPSLFITFLNG